MLLFFFMVSTTMREVTLNIKVKLPEATELSKLEKKSLVSYIYVGEPKPEFVKTFGLAPRIQLDDQWANVDDIQDFIIKERPSMITSLKVDENTKMGIVADIKQELRKAAALHINYSSRRKTEK
jgi:biopolymer transport protein ExbD